MEKTKKLITMTATHEEMLNQIMKQDGLSNRSVAVGNLILQEAKNRGILVIQVDQKPKEKIYEKLNENTI